MNYSRDWTKLELDRYKPHISLWDDGFSDVPQVGAGDVFAFVLFLVSLLAVWFVLAV